MTKVTVHRRAYPSSLIRDFVMAGANLPQNPEIVTTELKACRAEALAKAETVTHGWSPERRAAQRARMLARKPWLKSTGPRTNAGKKVSRMNGVRHGHRSAQMTKLLKLLAAQKRFVAAWHSGRYHPPKRRFPYGLPACGGRMKSPLSMFKTLVCLNLARRTMTAANSKGVP